MKVNAVAVIVGEPNSISVFLEIMFAIKPSVQQDNSDSGVSVGLGVCVTDGLGDGLGVMVGDGDGVNVGEGVCVGELVSDGVGVASSLINL